jgi:hypothetical protein
MDLQKQKQIIRASSKSARKEKMAELAIDAFAAGTLFTYTGEETVIAEFPPSKEPRRFHGEKDLWHPYKPNGRLRRNLITGRQDLAIMGTEALEEKNLLGQVFKKGTAAAAESPAIAARCLANAAFSFGDAEKKKPLKKKAAATEL